jgi:ABC-2 type transport system ATP-binding protein
MTAVIETRGLARTFATRAGPIEAVRGVSFAVAAGEIVGLLGPNGAGKTTTQRMLATLLVPTAGEATVAGCDLRRDPVGVRRRLGYVAQGGTTHPFARVDEELATQGELHGMRRREALRRAAELRELLELGDLGARLMKTLSGGQKRRVDIALGLVHRPRLVFLDEPTTGLDPQGRANLWRHIRALREGGATVLLTTHYLDEADALCDRILIVDHGAIVAEGTPAELKRRVSGDVVTIEVGAEAAEQARQALEGRPGVRELAVQGGAVRATVERGDADALALLRVLDEAGIATASIQIARPTLDDVFLTLTGRSLREASA